MEVRIMVTVANATLQFMSLQSGDMMSTGTPPGVGLGQRPPVYLKPGQTMRLGITGLEVQQQCTVSATRKPPG
jgi:2-keto-4-pentenoate hydratase/2-oxohepta-3-ene-1,7-dioic acid hydratase in catechol pathway